VPPPGPATHELLALETLGIKLGLDQIRDLLARLGRPDRAFPSIVVAGTNGKGSVTAMADAGLRAANLRTGRFTSPHLVRLEERFAIDGRPIAAGTLEAAAARLLRAARTMRHPPTFFEATTAIALDVFREAAVDVAVLEVGLGGRLDATNAVDAIASAITSVALDHEQYLGTTLPAIAREKAGVIKPGTFVVLARNPLDVEEAVAEAARNAGARLVRACDGVATDVHLLDGRARGAIETPVRRYSDLSLALAGRHQVDNAVCAIRLLEELSAAGPFDLPEHALRAAVEGVDWPARLERLTVAGVDVLIDGAHNPAGARALASFIAETFGRRLPLVVGAMRDKDLAALVRELGPAADRFVFTSASSERAARPSDLQAAASRVAPDVPVTLEADPIRAIRTAAAFGAPVVVAGSLYLAGQVRAGRS
jgi:dihydrofolate synthase/folylpolyglutamate synthase